MAMGLFGDRRGSFRLADGSRFPLDVELASDWAGMVICVSSKNGNRAG